MTFILKSHLEEALLQAFRTIAPKTVPASQVVQMASLRLSGRPDLADYQCNGALPLGKILGTAPREVAECISSLIEVPNVTTTIAGAGFLNFTLQSSALSQGLSGLLKDERLGIPLVADPETIIVDFGGPNAAKPMHVGHLRSSIIGESIKRLLRFLGHTVLGDIHLGDWGTQMGMLIEGLKQQHPTWPHFDLLFQGPYSNDIPLTLSDLEMIYPRMAQSTKEDEVLAASCRQATQELQQGRVGYRALWQKFVDLSIADMEPQFERLGITFDHWFGESRYQQHLQPLVDHLLKSGIAHKDEGAIIVPLAEDQDKTPMPPLLIQKTDGGFLYATTDIATIQERIQIFEAQRIIYVVDARQSLHFTQVFRAAHKMGLEATFEFLGFGTMNGPDNKPFKTRAGGVMRLSDLMATLQEAALAKMTEDNLLSDASPEEKERTALQIGIAALKFADLQHDAVQNYQFSLEKFLRFDGRTGPYLQYAAVRIQSLLRKASDFVLPLSFPDLPDPTSEERNLMMSLLQISDIIERAAHHLAPHILCEGAFDLAQSFSRFYQACPILTLEEGKLKTARLTLATLTHRELSLYLSLLGIDMPKRM